MQEIRIMRSNERRREQEKIERRQRMRAMIGMDYLMNNANVLMEYMNTLNHSVIIQKYLNNSFTANISMPKPRISNP